MCPYNVKMTNIKRIIAAVAAAFLLGSIPISASAGRLAALKAAFQQGKKAALQELQFLGEGLPSINFGSNSWSAGKVPYLHKVPSFSPDVPMERLIDLPDFAGHLQTDSSDREKISRIRCANGPAFINNRFCTADQELSGRKILENKASYYQE